MLKASAPIKKTDLVFKIKKTYQKLSWDSTFNISYLVTRNS